MRALKRLIIFLLLFTACEETVDLPLSPEDTDILVVEAVLTNERKNHLVRLSHAYALQNGEPQPATGATVLLLEDAAFSALVEFPEGSGMYYTPIGRAVFGKRYTLSIQYNGRRYLAQDSSVPVQPLEELQFRPGGDGYTLALNPSGQDANYVEHVIRWNNTPSCPRGATCEGKVVYYDLKTIDVNEVYKPDKALFSFPKQSIVIRKKYSVSPAYKDFLRSMLSETEWRGGLFDVQRSNVSTNLSTGAVGFFAVCSVVSDTTLVE